MSEVKAIIVAYDKNYGIGANNDLLWNLPADLKHFKEQTTGNAVIMGFNTYKSLGKPLPNRQNIIVSHVKDPIEGFQVVGSLEEAYKIVEPQRQTFIIGGGMIYKLAFDTVDRIIATEVDALFDNATVFFPEVDKSEWHEISREKHQADANNPYNYDFVVYERK